MIINEILTKISQPNMENNWILIPSIIMVISIFIPCIVWFVRNFLRIVLNKNIELLNRSLKWFFLIGFLIFIISVIILGLVASGVIKT